VLCFEIAPCGESLLLASCEQLSLQSGGRQPTPQFFSGMEKVPKAQYWILAIESEYKNSLKRMFMEMGMFSDRGCEN
jgi:hypothetical protein